jgi:hypothetical protein
MPAVCEGRRQTAATAEHPIEAKLLTARVEGASPKQAWELRRQKTTPHFTVYRPVDHHRHHPANRTCKGGRCNGGKPSKTAAVETGRQLKAADSEDIQTSKGLACSSAGCTEDCAIEAPESLIGCWTVAGLRQKVKLRPEAEEKLYPKRLAVNVTEQSDSFLDVL